MYPSHLINVIDAPAMWTGSHPQLVDGRGTVAIVSHQIGMTRPCGWERIPVCVAYDIDGRRVDELPMTQTEFHHAAPVYAYFDGWSDDIRDARTLDDLPENAQTYVKSLEDLSGAPISAIGVGPGREETVVIRPLLGGGGGPRSGWSTTLATAKRVAVDAPVTLTAPDATVTGVPEVVRSGTGYEEVRGRTRRAEGWVARWRRRRDDTVVLVDVS